MHAHALENLIFVITLCRAVLVVCLDTSPRYYAEFIKKNFPKYVSTCDITNMFSNISYFGLLDCYSNPIGWNSTLQTTEHVIVKKYGIRTLECTNITDMQALKDSLHQLISDQHVEADKDALLIFDTLTPLLKRHNITQVTRLVQSLIKVASSRNC